MDILCLLNGLKYSTSVIYDFIYETKKVFNLQSRLHRNRDLRIYKDTDVRKEKTYIIKNTVLKKREFNCLCIGVQKLKTWCFFLIYRPEEVFNIDKNHAIAIRSPICENIKHNHKNYLNNLFYCHSGFWFICFVLI